MGIRLMKGETTARDTLAVIRKVTMYVREEGMSHDEALRRAEQGHARYPASAAGVQAAKEAV